MIFCNTYSDFKNNHMYYNKDGCIWGEWVENDCSATCGPSTKIRRRYARIPEAANGNCTGTNETIPCDILLCPRTFGTVLIIHILH